MLVRTWNLFDGNIVPPDRHVHLREMVELITAGTPDVVCLQEIPVWALRGSATGAGCRPLTARAQAAEARARSRSRHRSAARSRAPRHGPIRARVRAARATRSCSRREATVREPQDDHPEHERLLRGARRPLRADAEGDGLVGARAPRLPRRPVRAARPRQRFLVANLHCDLAARGTSASPTPSCAGRSTSSSVPPSSRRR